MVLIRANQSGKAPEKQRWAKPWNSSDQQWQSMAIHSNGKAKMDNVMVMRSIVKAGRSKELLWQSKDSESIGKALGRIAMAKK